MFDIEDIENIEGSADTAEEYYESLQRAINGLSAWRMQGSYGRAMMQALTDGYCLLGREHTRDYWGNRIPSREEVKRGTKGSIEYVAQIHGQEYADRMEAI
jgi:hypothetical protein